MIKFLDLKKINERYEEEFKRGLSRFLDSGRYILGSQVAQFEKSYAAYCGANHCIGVANGLDALMLIFKAYIEMGKLEEKDEVIVPANTFIATILAIEHCGLKPVLVEPDPTTYNITATNIEKSITSKTKAVLVVHLYGQLVDLKNIKDIAKSNKLLLIEDAAQAHGAQNELGHKAGNLADAAGFSFYPSKNFGALGDGGAITTNDEDLAKLIRKLHNYGTTSKYKNKYKGLNSRLDEIQAMFLNIKLPTLDDDNKRRREIAKMYLNGINNSRIALPFYNGSDDHVFHVFVIETDNRDELKDLLAKKDIQCSIHYPTPPHYQEALAEYSHLELPITVRIHERVISLPMSPILRDDQVQIVIDALNKY